MSNTSVLCLLMLSGIGIGVRPLLAQSLADVAQQEEDRRKAIPKPAKVYTNKDLHAVPPGQPPVEPPTSEAAKDVDKTKAEQDKAGKDSEGRDAKEKDAKGATDKDTPAKDQAYWSGRLKDLRTQIERDQGYADAMQTRLNSLDADFVNRDDPVQRAAIDRDRQKTRTELARLTKAIQDGTKAVADLLEEARRAAVPPGWLR